MKFEEWVELYDMYVVAALSRQHAAASPNEARWWGRVALTLDDERRGRVHHLNLIV